MQIAGHDHHRLLQRFPEPDHLLALLEERRPCIVFVLYETAAGRTLMRYRHVHRRCDEEEIGIARLHQLDQPLLLTPSEERDAGLVWILRVLQIAGGTGIQEKELRVPDTEIRERHSAE